MFLLRVLISTFVFDKNKMIPQVHTLQSISDYFELAESDRIQVMNTFSEETLSVAPDLFSLIDKIGTASDKSKEAEELIFDIDERVNIVTHKLKFIKENNKPKVLLLSEVIPPSINSNEYCQLLIKMAGGKIVAEEEFEADEANPDVIILLSETMERMFGGLANMLSLEEWKKTNAVKKNQVFLIDGSRHLKNWDVNFASDLEVLAEILYPQYLTFSDNGESWIRFEL